MERWFWGVRVISNEYCRLFNYLGQIKCPPLLVPLHLPALNVLACSLALKMTLNNDIKKKKKFSSPIELSYCLKSSIFHLLHLIFILVCNIFPPLCIPLVNCLSLHSVLLISTNSYSCPIRNITGEFIRLTKHKTNKQKKKNDINFRFCLFFFRRQESLMLDGSEKHLKDLEELICTKWQSGHLAKGWWVALPCG